MTIGTSYFTLVNGFTRLSMGIDVERRMLRMGLVHYGVADELLSDDSAYGNAFRNGLSVSAPARRFLRRVVNYLHLQAVDSSGSWNESICEALGICYEALINVYVEAQTDITVALMAMSGATTHEA